MRRTIRYVASLAWIMILLQNCHPEHKLNIDPLEVATSTPRFADQGDKRVVSLPPHAAVGQHPLSNSASSPISVHPPQHELVRTTNATTLGTSLMNAQASFGPLSASSGERVIFKQEGNKWYAETPLGVLPVRSQETVDTYLHWLCSQDLCVSRSRVNIMQNPNDHGRCVYLGKVGLLGGSPTTQGEEWRPGPTITLNSNETHTEVYHIPQGYRYVGYRLKPGSVINRASCTIRYVEANSCEELDELSGCNDGGALEVKLSANAFGNVVNLGTVGVGSQIVRMKGRKGLSIPNFSHAALVIYGSTKNSELGRERKKLKVMIEISLKKELKPAQATVVNCEQEVRPMLPAMAFGAREWEEHMGIEVGEEPPLPTDIDEILNADCPFLLDKEWKTQKVRDNHLLVLIPARINGEPFTLNKLGALIKAKAFPQNVYGYGYYRDTVREELGNKPLAQTPYWILLTRRVMEDSLNQRLSAHEKMIAKHSGYRMPYALEAATAILTHYVRSGQLLYSTDPFTHTRCREIVGSNHSVFVGAFDPSGLEVSYNETSDNYDGVAGCRKLEERLLKVEKKKRSVGEEYEDSLSLQSQQETSSPIEVELQTRLKMKELGQAQAKANREQEDHATLYSMAFGAREWKKYLGVSPGWEPSLPPDIGKILNADCPFLLEGESTPQKVKDNHVLVLIPARVNGKPFTLNKLGALIKVHAFSQNEYGYGSYSDAVRKEMGSKQLTQTSYWILLTRRVLKGSLNQRLSVHKAMIKEHDGYSMPHALEAATAMLAHYVRSGQRLYGDEPWRYTRCRETMMGSNTYSVFVGAFDSSGLEVDDCYSEISDSGGVSGCRKL